jgi:hypothetical protein
MNRDGNLNPCATKSVFLGSGAQPDLLSFQPERSGVFVISTGAQRSGEIWPAIRRTFPFEIRFLRYVMLRLTPVANDKIHVCFFRQIIVVILGSDPQNRTAISGLTIGLFQQPPPLSQRYSLKSQRSAIILFCEIRFDRSFIKRKPL